MKTYEYYLLQYNHLSPPVDIFGLVENFGVEVIRMPLKKLDGFCAQMDESQYDIGINSSLPFPRQRFTLAHEFKHFLHKEASISQKGNLACDHVVFDMENDANDFAGKLLVDGYYLAKYRQIFGVRELSEIF